MLSRRHLRIKVLQALYAFFQNETEDLIRGEKTLINSLEKFIELVFWQLGVLPELHFIAERRIEDNRRKHLPSDEDINPNLRFVENKLLLALSKNRSLKRAMLQYKVIWMEDEEIVRKLFNEIRNSGTYKEFMQENTSSFIEDKGFILKLYKKEICNSGTLLTFYDDRNIFWAEELDHANIIVQKLLKGIEEENHENYTIPPIFEFKPSHENEDLAFLLTLFRKSILSSEQFNELIVKKTENWDFERIAMMDVIILKMALTELVEFPSIPIKVSMNEYIELAKRFSTPKSSIFVNGILDKLMAEMMEQGMIKKAGRGLISE